MRKILSIYTFFIIFFLSTPLLIPLGFPLVILLFLALILSFHSFKLNFLELKKLPVILIIVYFISILTLVFRYKSGHFLLYFSGFLMAFFLVRSLSIFEVNKYIDKMSNIILFMLIGAYIGLFMHFFGFGYIYKFNNPNGDENLLYFLTLTNAKSGHFIRPSGLFAEPGYFGFVISVVIFLRQIFGKNANFSLLLIVLTFVTQSIVFFIFTAFWFIDYFRLNSSGIKAAFLKYTLISLSVLAIIVLIKLDFFVWFQERVEGFVTDEIFNARVIAWNDLIEKIKSQPVSALIFGFDEECIFRTDNCFSLGGVPLVPLLYGGLIYSWPYYLFIIYLTYLSFVLEKVRFSCIGIIFTAFSQPVFLELPYSLIYMFLFHGIILAKNFNFLNLKLQRNNFQI